MVELRIFPSDVFVKQIKRLDNFQKEKLEKQIKKILANPFTGKPLKYKKSERSLYVKPFRLVYSLRKDEIILLKFEHRKSVYIK